MKRVFYSDALRRTELSCGARVHEPELQGFIDAKRSMEMHGEAPPPAWIPGAYVWPYLDGRLEPPAPGFFTAGGYLMATDGCAARMRGLDLGAGRLQAAVLLQNDGQTEVAGRYWTVVFGAAKRTVDPDASRIVVNRYDRTKWRVPFDVADGDIVVRAGATEGADVWVEPSISMALFVSERLVDALGELGAGLFLRSCRVLPA